MAKSNTGESGPKRKDDDCDMVTSLQSTELSRNEMCFHEAARTGNKELLMRFLKKNAANVQCRNNIDRTALHMAASNGHRDCVEILLKHKAVIDSPDKYGMTPLLWTAYFGKLDVFTLLIDKNANYNKKNKQGYDISHIAAEKNHPEILDKLLLKFKHFKIDEPDNNGLTPFLIAVTNNSVDMVDFLMPRNINITNIDKSKRNALHLSAKGGYLDIMKKFEDISDLIDLVDEKDADELTPLYYACDNGHLEVVKLLLHYEASVDLVCKNMTTPLQIASQKNHPEIVSLLLENKADINAQNEQGNTALHLVTLINLAPMVKHLLNNNACRDLRNKRDQTPLHTGVEQNKCDAVEVLLLRCESISELYQIDKTGKTPLLMAARSSYISMVDMLIKADQYIRKKEKLKNSTDDTDAVVLNGDAFRPSDYHNVYNIHIEERKKFTSESHNFSLKEFNQPYAEEFKLYLWKIAFNHLRFGEWKKLAHFWSFQPEHILAIEYQHVHNDSYKYHGYRLLCIWFHGVDLRDTPIRGLYEALVSIGRRKLADKMRRELDNHAQGRSGSNSHCSIS